MVGKAFGMTIMNYINFTIKVSIIIATDIIVENSG